MRQSLIAGLGNPGAEYESTRHNAGFMVLELLARRHGEKHWKSGHEALMCSIVLGENKLLLLRPVTYMNLSGRSVAAAMKFYGLTPEDLLVVVDDTALACGTIRLRAGGSSGGHNGLKSIERSLAELATEAGRTGQDFSRLRVGIDNPGRVAQETYVLERFSPAQKQTIEPALSRAADAVEYWAAFGIVAAMNRFNATVEDPK
ncbi:MAG TPA: aminoacyl-tRNA hydrolase [Phycisphaerae bacterium]|nr:aminoacyl-tRNA hydrolase [Phycisphaerae bacterium]